jgi:hypothetical protein
MDFLIAGFKVRSRRMFLQKGEVVGRLLRGVGVRVDGGKVTERLGKCFRVDLDGLWNFLNFFVFFGVFAKSGCCLMVFAGCACTQKDSKGDRTVRAVF